MPTADGRLFSKGHHVDHLCDNNSIKYESRDVIQVLFCFAYISMNSPREYGCQIKGVLLQGWMLVFFRMTDDNVILMPKSNVDKNT